MPECQASRLPPKPGTIPQEQASSEWKLWEAARYTFGNGGIGAEQGIGSCTSPKHPTVIGMKMVFNRKVGADGEVERCNFRFVAQISRQVSGLKYNESYAPTPEAASTMMLQAKAAWIRHVDVQQAFFRVAVEEEVCIHLPEKF